MKSINNHKIITTVILLYLFVVKIEAQNVIKTFPYISNFDNYGTEWVNIENKDDIDWLFAYSKDVHSYGTGSQDKDKGYLYIESSFPNNDKQQAWLELVVDFTDLKAPEILFDYQMYASHKKGEGPGALQLDIHDGKTWVYDLWHNHNSNEKWKSKRIDLSKYSGKVVILSFTGFTTGWQSDICIDNIVIRDRKNLTSNN